MSSPAVQQPCKVILSLQAEFNHNQPTGHDAAANILELAHLKLYAKQVAHFKGIDMLMHTACHVALHGMLQTLHDWC